MMGLRDEIEVLCETEFLQLDLRRRILRGECLSCGRPAERWNWKGKCWCARCWDAFSCLWDEKGKRVYEKPVRVWESGHGSVASSRGRRVWPDALKD